MDIELDASMAQERTLRCWLPPSAFWLALMSAVGLYGVLAYDTLQRTREIGVRMALGASRRAVARLLMVETLRLAGISILVGYRWPGAFARLAKSLLFGVQSADPLTYAAVALLVALVAVAASVIPTLAGHVDRADAGPALRVRSIGNRTGHNRDRKRRRSALFRHKKV